MSLVVSGEMAGLQPSSSRTPTGTFDACFTNRENIEGNRQHGEKSSNQCHL